MTVKTYKAAGAILLLAALPLFAGCKGRTAENMVPNGETVEVVLDETVGAELPQELPADSSAPAPEAI